MTNAPFFSDIAQGPTGGVAHWVTTSDGLKIRIATWVPLEKGAQDALKGTVLIFPGRTEYIEKYGPAAAEFRARGYAALAVDWRGQGLADRTSDNPLLGDVVDFKDYQNDVAAILAHADALNLPKPYYLAAHSMGGCIGLRAVMADMPVKAAVFSAPMWGIQMSGPMRPLAWALSTVSRRMGFETTVALGQSTQPYVSRIGFAENTLTSDQDMFTFMRDQLKAHPELALGGPTLRWLNESLIEMRDLAQMPSPALPCITFLGTDEAIVDATDIKTRMTTWAGGTLHLLTMGRHETMMETPAMRKEVFDATTALFDAHQ